MVEEHLTEEEVAALALAPQDTPRLPAVQHVEACAECRERVAGVQRVMRAADTWAQPPVRSAELAAMRARLEAELGLAAAASAAPATPRTAKAPLAAVTRAIDWVRVFVPAAASVLLAFVLGKGHLHDAPALELTCALIELGAAGLFAAGGYLLVRQRLQASEGAAPMRERAPFLLASVAGTGALLGQVWIHDFCPAAPGSAHAFVTHSGAVMLAVVAGLVITRSMIARRASR